MNFVPLHVHSHFSILDGLSKPDQIVQRCKKLGYTACGLTDHGTISGCVAFYKACKEEGIKPILGCELYITDRDPDDKDALVSHLCVLAKNKKGWDNLVKIVSMANDHFYYKPRISLEMIKPFGEGLIAFSGHPGSTLANCLFDTRDVYGMSQNDAQKHIVMNVHKVAQKELYKHLDTFEYFFLESQMIDKDNVPVVHLIKTILTEVVENFHQDNMKELLSEDPTASDFGECLKPSFLATGDSHYPSKKDVDDHRLLLCSNLKTTFAEIDKKRQRGESLPLEGFFKSDNYHIPSLEEMQKVNSEEEIATSVAIADMCEEYDILGKPMLPDFICPESMDQTQYLTELCCQGYRKKLSHIPQEKKNEYGDRFRAELAVIEKAQLEGYFLVVQDYVNHAKKEGQLVGPARGSAAGSLISYLLNITNIDPIEYGLIFERFYNEGRNTKDHVSLPDIDVDFPKRYRSKLIEYLREKYGHDKVCQIITFGRMQGRSALKEVLRVHGACSYEEMNTITQILPGEAEISDQMEEDKETSIIKWTLEHDGDRKNGDYTLSDYCIFKDGKFEGDYAQYFEQAIRLEGTFKSSGKHAAGIVISKVPLSEVCPMVHDSKGSEKIAGIEQKDLEAMGHVKFDILAVALLDRLMYVNELEEKYGTD